MEGWLSIQKMDKRLCIIKLFITFYSSNRLEFSGFDMVKRYDWQKTIHKDYDDHSQAYYPHMDKENGIY